MFAPGWVLRCLLIFPERARMLVAMGQGPILIGLGRALRCFKTVLGRAPMRVAVSQGVILI